MSTNDSRWPVTATIDACAIPAIANRARMRAARFAKLVDALDAHECDGLVVFGSANVAYATGADAPATDAARAMLARSCALVARGETQPYLATPYPDGVPAELGNDRVAAAAYPDLEDGAAQVAAWIAERVPRHARVAVDEVPHPLARALQAVGVSVVSAAPLLSAAKLEKTVDEVACIRAAQHLTERAMADVVGLLAPGVTQTDLSAQFLRRVFELGVENVGVDPIWQVMGSTRATNPITLHGDIGFPVASRADVVLQQGDVIWNDTGLHVGGYASDFGRTWIVGDHPKPSAAHQALCDRWQQIVTACTQAARPGVTARDLAQLAIDCNGGVKPWLSHFYLAHGIGTTSAELPMIGTDLGDAFDESQVLRAGQILVFEPVIWEDGVGGYRAEDVVVVTDEGGVSLCDFSFAPFEELS